MGLCTRARCQFGEARIKRPRGLNRQSPEVMDLRRDPGWEPKKRDAATAALRDS
jgi:hypothetical protein